MAVVELFRALGDRTRLEMVRRLSDGDSYTITMLSSGLDVTRQGARKHLQTLADAKLVTLQSRGRDTIVLLDWGALERSKAFIVELEQRWDARLEALHQLVDGE